MVKSKVRITFKSFLIILGIILLFTATDYAIHSLSEEYAVPNYYYKNKVIFGSIIGFVAYILIRNKNPFPKSLIFSTTVAILLQIRYFLEGYPLDFVIEFLFIHFAILLVLSYITFKLLKKYL
ncbi:MAG: hypothetical protein Q8L29_01315 [archaeon]|nr:hypothetical protein [archaeon]